jgi:hypothetical protein
MIIHERKDCFLHQGAGLGDILWLQKAASFLAQNYRVVHPVIPQYLDVCLKYVKSEALFISNEGQNTEDSYRFPNNGAKCLLNPAGNLYVPFNEASKTIPGCVMRAKYKLIDLDWHDWQDYLIINRDYHREAQFKEYLNLPEKYNVINRMFGTAPGTYIKHEVRSDNDLPNIEINFIDGANIFDWMGVLQGAENIFTVDSVILFLIEKMTIKTTNLQLWSRWNNYEAIDGLFNKKWNYN